MSTPENDSPTPLTFADSKVGRATVLAITGFGAAFLLLAIAMMFT